MALYFLHKGIILSGDHGIKNVPVLEHFEQNSFHFCCYIVKHHGWID